jgi:bisphosphoglycerate-independent phosphoglycerate mutase (AlkP superfamily)
MQNGSLEDVAPTVLQLMHVDQPKEMTGHALLKTLTTSR